MRPSHRSLKIQAPRHPRGFTLVEAMVSFGILAFGMLGLASAYVAASRADGQGMRISQATSIAQGLGHFLLLLDWSDARLSDPLPCNDADVDDQSHAFEETAPACQADHQAQLAGLGSASAANDLQPTDGFAASDALDYNGDAAPDFEIFWNVADCIVRSTTSPWAIDCDGVSAAAANFKQIGILVRWKRGDGKWFEVTSQIHRFNPSNLGT